MTDPTTDTKPVTTDPVTGAPTAVPSAKVAAGAITSVALLVVVAVLSAVTPDMLTFAGSFSPLIYAAIVALGGSLAAYIKRP